MKSGIENRWNVVARRVCAVALSGTLAFSLAGCAAGSSASSAGSSGEFSTAASESASASGSASSQTGQQNTTTVAYAAEIDESPYDLEYTKRESDPSYDEAKATLITLNGSTAESSGNNVAVNGSTITVSAEGVYVLSGSLDNGQVVVNAPEDAKVQIVMKGASVTNASGPALMVKQADKCFVTLAEGTENALADGAEYANAESDENAALYSDCDLTLQGGGQLSVSGNFKDAVKTKDDLVITGGSYTIKSASDALNGHDSVKISAGTFAIDAGNDGIKSSKDDDESKGFVSIDGGTFVLNAADKAINAVRYIRVAGAAKMDITAAGDAIHSDNFARIMGGELAISSGDDAVHAEYVLAIDDGSIDITKCVEGYEAQVITVNGSTTHIVASDDAINASPGGTTSNSNNAQMPGGFDRNREQGTGRNQGADQAQGADQSQGANQGKNTGQDAGQAPSMRQDPSEPQGQAEGQGNGPSQKQAPDGNAAQGQGASTPDGGTMPPDRGMGGRGGGGMMDSDENCILTINGGTITVESEGDGVDSNGYIYQNGGEVYVSGPSSSGNGSLDYGLGAEITGGTFIAAGSAGMAETFTKGPQASALVNANGSAGSTIEVTNANGEKLAGFTPTKDFQCVIVSAPGMTDGGEYVLSVNDSTTSFTASTSAQAGGMGQMGGRGNRGDAPWGEGRQNGRRGENQQGGTQDGNRQNNTPPNESQQGDNQAVNA